MTPRRVLLFERLALLAGCALIVLAIAAYEVRLGALAAGVILVVSAVDLPGRRP